MASKTSNRLCNVVVAVTTLLDACLEDALWLTELEKRAQNAVIPISWETARTTIRVAFGKRCWLVDAGNVCR